MRQTYPPRIDIALLMRRIKIGKEIGPHYGLEDKKTLFDHISRATEVMMMITEFHYYSS